MNELVTYLKGRPNDMKKSFEKAGTTMTAACSKRLDFTMGDNSLLLADLV